VREGNALVSYELLVGQDGRIAARHEDVAGSSTFFAYVYDDTGRLLQAWRNGHLAEDYAYDPRGAHASSPGVPGRGSGNTATTNAAN